MHQTVGLGCALPTLTADRCREQSRLYTAFIHWLLAWLPSTRGSSSLPLSLSLLLVSLLLLLPLVLLLLLLLPLVLLLLAAFRLRFSTCFAVTWMACRETDLSIVSS